MIINNRSHHRRCLRTGTTLIETMVSVIILAVIALGSAASLRYSQSLTNLQRNHRLAMEKANGRLDELRAATFTDISPTNNYAVYFLDRITGSWRISTANRGETFLLGGQPHAMTTTIQYVDINGSGSSFACLRINVRAQYGSKTGDVVVLETLESLL